MRLYAAILAATLSSPAVAADYLGKVTAVVDGDTFTMVSETGRVRVRICGIDAPERGQPGYGQAAGVLAAMIEGKTVHCLQVGVRRPVEADQPRPHRRAVFHRQARHRRGDGEIRNGLRLAEVLRRSLQDQ